MISSVAKMYWHYSLAVFNVFTGLYYGFTFRWGFAAISLVGVIAALWLAWCDVLEFFDAEA